MLWDAWVPLIPLICRFDHCTFCSIFFPFTCCCYARENEHVNSYWSQLANSSMEYDPLYDADKSFKVMPSSFHDISEVEFQDNWGRVWYDFLDSSALLFPVSYTLFSYWSFSWKIMTNFMFLLQGRPWYFWFFFHWCPPQLYDSIECRVSLSYSNI